MSTIARFLQVFALGTWVGSIVFLSFVVAPGAFATLPARDQAGAVVGMALARLHVLGYVAGAVYLVVTAFRGQSAAALARPAVLVVVLMLALTLVSQQWVSPRLAGLRAEMGSVHGEQGRTMDRTPADHSLRVEFNHLHQLSVCSKRVSCCLALPLCSSPSAIPESLSLPQIGFTACCRGGVLVCPAACAPGSSAFRRWARRACSKS